MSSPISEKLARYLVPPSKSLPLENEVQQTFPSVGIEVPEADALKIFQALPPSEIPTVARICKTWCRIVCAESFWYSYDVRALLPKAKIIDKEAWKRRVPKEILKLLEFADGYRPCISRSTFREIRLSKIPRYQLFIVEFPKGLSFKILSSIGKDNRIGAATNFVVTHALDNPDWSKDLPEGYINQCTENAHTIIISQQILKDSVDLLRSDKIKLISIPNRELRIIDVATLAVFSRKECGLDVYPTETMCIDVMSKTTEHGGMFAAIGNSNIGYWTRPSDSDCGVGAKWVLQHIKI